MQSRLAGGFTLVEVLVAVLMLAIGVIGAAGTQLAALRTRHGSALMSEGVQLASSLADRMRANTLQMQRGDGANPYLQLQYNSAAGAPPSPPAMCFAGTACASEQIAAFDLYELASALHASFPSGRVSVCRDATIWDAAAGKLSWNCAGGAGAPLVIKLGWRERGSGGKTGLEDVAPMVAMVVGESSP